MGLKQILTVSIREEQNWFYVSFLEGSVHEFSGCKEVHSEVFRGTEAESIASVILYCLNDLCKFFYVNVVTKESLLYCPTCFQLSRLW